MKDKTSRKVWYVDEKGDVSSGRIFSAIGIVLAVEVVNVGLFLAVYEIIKNTNKSAGAALVGIGLGLFTSGALLKGWQKQSEVKVESSLDESKGG